MLKVNIIVVIYIVDTDNGMTSFKKALTNMETNEARGSSN
ncbi:hypothetical protein CSC18_2087 [Klebsiella aerogenes]|nr:hypothetical protein CSC18_2087 [Klebsiella aerogenes]